MAPSIEVRCATCDEPFILSTRRELEYRREGRKPICTTCRRAPKPMSARERERFRKWWLERFSLDELRELASAIWG